MLIFLNFEYIASDFLVDLRSEHRNYWYSNQLPSRNFEEDDAVPKEASLNGRVGIRWKSLTTVATILKK